MFAKVLLASKTNVSSEARKVVISRTTDIGFDPQDSLNSIREYRLRKVASKRIPSRIS
ncbi:MAG: hypothetical protein RIE24_11240 [Silicimonas sp.]